MSMSMKKDLGHECIDLVDVTTISRNTQIDKDWIGKYPFLFEESYFLDLDQIDKSAGEKIWENGLL